MRSPRVPVLIPLNFVQSTEVDLVNLNPYRLFDFFVSERWGGTCSGCGE